MNSLLQTFCLSFVVLLLWIQRGDLRPPPCKDGQFYEESVFAYFNCSFCIEQSHYSNCKVCCPATVTPTTSRSTPTTTPSVSSFGVKLQPSFEVSGNVESVPNGLLSVEPEVLIIIGYFTGFLTMLVIAGLLVCAIKYCRKRKKGKKLAMGSLTSVRPGMQETQLNSLSPMVMGLSGCDPVAL